MPEMMTGARSLVTLPAPTPLGGGVLSVARIVDTTGHELMGAEADTDACATVEEWEEWCTMSPTGHKVFDGPTDVVTGDPFAVYAGVECPMNSMADNAARARNRLAFAESRAVDLHIAAMLATDAVNVGTGPFPLGEAIGTAEAFAATVYGGVPTLLIPRQLIECDCCFSLHTNLDGTQTTRNGSNVVALTTPVTVPATTSADTIYITGQITMFRSPVNVISVPPQVANNGTYSPARALAERIYVPVFDCLVAKVGATCSAP